MRGFVIAATGSGSGKTTITLGILAYLTKLGYNVAPFKIGPDFIDPGHHSALTGKISRNLDSWMLSKESNEDIFMRGCKGADIAVVEGVMGLFDGYSGTSEEGSTAQMAKWMGLPVILVVDARSMARSAAALVHGFETFDPDLNFAGVIFSKTGSERHYRYLKEAIESRCNTRCIGHIPRDPLLTMPERHLGLVTSQEQTISREAVERLISVLDKETSLRELVEKLPSFTLSQTEKVSILDSQEAGRGSRSEGAGNEISAESDLRIGVARDRAFCFYYQENIEALERAGATIVEFSPIADKNIPPDLDGLYFGGGYPELFAEELSMNMVIIDEVREMSLHGMPIYGECGGFMYLCKEITGMDGTARRSRESYEISDRSGGDDRAPDAEVKSFPMAGCFPFTAVMSKRMRSLGYREIKLEDDTVIGKRGSVLRGHEFHYSSLDQENSDSGSSEVSKVYSTAGREGQIISLEGYRIRNTLGSYLHVHFESNPSAAMEFVEKCREFAAGKRS